MYRVGSILTSRITIAVLVIIAALVAFRIALPHLVLDYVNRSLDSMEGYQGHVQDIDLHLWRGAFDVHGLAVEKTGGTIPVPFLDVARIESSIQWSEILNGAYVGEIVLHQPELNFVAGPTDDTSQTEVPATWIEVTGDLLPFSINQLEMRDGIVHYRDFHSDPEIDVSMEKLYLVASNLRNSRSVGQSKFATATLYNLPDEGDPKLEVSLNLDTFAQDPTFDMNFALNDLALTRLNDFLRAYGNFDVESGTFTIYSEIVAQQGSYEGYVKPLFEDLKVVDWKEDQDPLELAWETIVGGAASILENKPTGRVATRIPIEGDFEEQEVDYWAAVINLLRNAFIQAIRPAFEDITPGRSVGE